MKNFKNYLNRLFIDGLSGMALGLFATLIIGTIIKQIGSYIPGAVGYYLILIGQCASLLTGAGIGIGVAVKLNEKAPLLVISAATAGLIGAYASKIIAGSFPRPANRSAHSSPHTRLSRSAGSFRGKPLST